eukprot:m.137633 g.137633  ORF g.137633 m.137633 type:complete len:57 (+) comp12051_c0_seq1:664-834(+)
MISMHNFSWAEILVHKIHLLQQFLLMVFQFSHHLSKLNSNNKTVNPTPTLLPTAQL